jgi:hypothetical protein
VLIDHMNDGSAYAARLRAWADAAGLRGCLLFQPAPRAASGQRLAAPNRREGALRCGRRTYARRRTYASSTRVEGRI